jgi:activator of HSP90 ATPase
MHRIHQEVTFDASPARVYRALLDAKEHATFTGAPAEISADEGARFSVYGGKVSGRNVEIVPDALIVQAWRVSDWPAGVYTLARFELKGEGKATRLVFDQDGIPDGAGEHLDVGWKRMYWDPLHKYFGA